MVTGNISGVPVIAIYQSLLRTTAFDTIHQNVTRAIICVQLDMELYSRTESGESKLLADDAGVHHLEHIIADGPPGVSNADKHPSFTTQYHGTRFTVSAHRWRVIQGGDSAVIAVNRDSSSRPSAAGQTYFTKATRREAKYSVQDNFMLLILRIRLLEPRGMQQGAAHPPP
jgi:hypothetical protein